MEVIGLFNRNVYPLLYLSINCYKISQRYKYHCPHFQNSYIYQLGLVHVVVNKFRQYVKLIFNFNFASSKFSMSRVGRTLIKI